MFVLLKATLDRKILVGRCSYNNAYAYLHLIPFLVSLAAWVSQVAKNKVTIEVELRS